MKAGDVCKCISNFNGELSGELILQKNDIVQIHHVIDKLWLEGEGGGNIGKFPSSIVVKTEIPPHPPDATIYVAFADFAPMQDGDLPLMRGAFITEISLVDEDWAYGESYGSKGVFPLNFVWKINKSIYSVKDTSEKPVYYIGKVLTSIKAQLPEELDLWKGDTVTVTHVIDEDWYRGESNGETGIFPKSFVEIIEELDIEKNVPPSFLSQNSSESSQSLQTLTDILIENSNDFGTNDNTNSYVDNSNAHTIDTGLVHFGNGTVSNTSNINESPVSNTSNINQGSVSNTSNINQGIVSKTSNINQDWKNVDGTTDELLNDDYFKINLPSMYAGTKVDTGESVQSSKKLDTNQDHFNCFEVASVSQNSEIPDTSLVPIDSLSAKIDEYFDCSASNLRDSNAAAIHEDLLDIDFTGVYTEDNTGINPYGRAVFSFTAKYQNELSFRKGDIIHLIRHIDSHWTVGKLGVLKGIFPTSYIDIIVDCPYKAEDAFKKRTDAIKKAIVCFDYEATASEDVSAKEGDVALITKFVSDSWVEIELADGRFGLIPLNHLNVFDDNLPETSKVGENISPLPVRRNYVKDDFVPKKNEKDIESELIKNISSLDMSCKHSKPSANNRPEDIFSDIQENSENNVNSVDIANSFEKHKSSYLDKSTTSNEVDKIETLLQVKQKLFSEEGGSKVDLISNENNYKKDIKSSKSYPHNLSSRANSIKEFPRDMKSSSMPLDRVLSTDKNAECLESEISPQRPAPPLPLHSDSENEDFYSISSGGEEGAQTQAKKDEMDDDSVENKEPGENEMDSKYAKKLVMRRESINELVTTEYEYIHDLESLVQVVKLGQRRKEACDVDLKVLMGNINDVIELSKKFVKELNKVSYNDDEELLVGPVFLTLAPEICDVYKVYSSNNSLSVGPLLKKYQTSGDDSEAFLKWVLTELRQHKVNLLDMQAVLIKPVQRVLKYPLFIDNLVQNTPHSHPDFQNLEEAKNNMLNVAKEINEYTKRLDLVAKYRHGSQHSFGEMIQRVSMRTFAKKGSRIRTRISATMGLMNKTKDLKFEEEEAKFRALIKVSMTLSEQGTKLVEVIRGRHKAELGIIDAIASTLSKDSKVSYIETLKNISENVCCKVLPLFERTAMTRVINPVKRLLSMCSAPDHLIQKRYDKLLDYDKAQHKLDKNKDPSRTRILEEELKIAQGTYDALNTQLLMDLPTLNEHGTSVLVLALRSLVAARMNLEGHVTNFYLKLSQSNVFSYLNNEEYLNNFKLKHVELMSSLKNLQFVTAEFSPKSPKFVRRKSSLRSLVRRGEKGDKKASSREKLKEQAELTEKYDSSMIYMATTNHNPEDTLDIHVQQGSLVGVIKMKDPSGSSSRWYVDNGSEKGFVKSCCLQKYFVDQTSPIENRNRASGISQHTPSPEERRRSSSQEPVELPPKYEDIFPQQACSVRPAAVPELNNVYEEINEPQKRDKTKEFREDTSKVRYPTEVLSVVHRYEDIEESLGEQEPIYETIPADEVPEVMETKQIFFPEPDENAPQFYYSLYHFGGNDQNQLPLHEGQVVFLLFAQGSDWWFVEDRTGRRGYVPAAYLSKYT